MEVFVYCDFEMNVLRWCFFVHLFDTPFQNSPYGHDLINEYNNETFH